MTTQHIWTGPVILTLCISLLALAVAGASLTWQIISWRRSSPRVSVKTVSGIGGRPGVWFVGVEATNSGRLGIEIEQFGFQLPNGRHIQAIHDYLGQPVELPMPLAPGRTATMRYAARHIWEILRQEGVSGENVRPYVAANWRPVSSEHGRFEGDAIHLGQRIANLH
jgi:hypothetical protein